MGLWDEVKRTIQGHNNVGTVVLEEQVLVKCFCKNMSVIQSIFFYKNIIFTVPKASSEKDKKESCY